MGEYQRTIHPGIFKYIHSKMTQRDAHLAEQFQKDQVNKLDGLFDGI